MAAAITSIIGLQNLANLQEFRADYNYLTTVNLSGLENLTTVDISDCEVPGTNDNSLTSVNLSGCVTLAELRLDDSDFSAGIPDLTGLTSLNFFDMDQCGITGGIDISHLSLLTGFDLSGNIGITSIQLPETSINSANLGNNALTEVAVNYVLSLLDSSGGVNGYVDVSGGTSAPPTDFGLTAVINLQNKGWTVYVN